jgi:heptosyltransferase-2
MEPERGPGPTSLAARVPNWLGDAVLAVPAVRALAGASRQTSLLVLSSRVSGEVCRRVHGTLVFSIATAGGTIGRSVTTALEGARVLRRYEPVMAFSFTRSFTSAATLLLGGVSRRVGFARSAGSFLYTDRVETPPGGRGHLCDEYRRLVESLGIPVKETMPRLEPAAHDLDEGERTMAGHGLKRRRFVCLFPGARYGASKRWGSDRFALLGDALIAKLGLDIVILGGPEDRSICETVRSNMGSKALDLSGRCSFAALVGILSLAGGVVANDSGGMHLAAALGTPVVGLFFSTDPSWTGPRSPRATALYNRAECSPCFRRDCDRETMCTGTISVEDAFQALTKLIVSAV